MRISFSQVFTVLLVTLSAVALTQVSVALGSSHGYGDSPNTTQTVRSYYASINAFLSGGDAVDELAEPSPLLGALRSTYPNMRFEISDISIKTDARPFSYGLPGFLPRCDLAAGANDLACSAFFALRRGRAGTALSQSFL